jgi:hypothetical protein
MQNTIKNTNNPAVLAGKVVNWLISTLGSAYCIYGIYWLVQHGYFH